MTRRLASALLASLLVLLSAGACAAAPRAASAPARAPSDTAALRRTLEGVMQGYAGTAGVSVRNLRTGEQLSIRGGETFPSASLVKVPVLVALLDQVRRGNVRLDERMGMIARDRVGGSGVLQFMESGLPLTLGDAAWLMIVLSDNTATNLLLDKLNIRTVWEKMDSLGLPHTKIHSKTFIRATSLAPDSSVKYGLGVAVPDEMVRLFALLHEGRAVSPALDSLALRMLRANQDGSKLVRWLPEDVPVAHKSGDVDRARNDCGIIYGPDAPVAVCVMTRDNVETTYAVDAPAHLLIGRIGREVFRHYNPSAQLPPLPPAQR
jgi:beta-lactamase class A